MRTILVMNPKGGSGKSTIAMNIAGYFAQRGRRVALADCDTQRSCADWLAVRPASAAPILSAKIAGDRIEVAGGRAEFAVIDTPAALHGRALAAYVRAAETLVIPMLPSPIDMRAAERFIAELFDVRSLINRKVKLATLANRVREDTLIAAGLQNFLDGLRLPGGRPLPFITVLRQSQNYMRAAERGLSIFEFAPARTVLDQEQWQPLLRWLSGPRSVPD